MYRLCSCAAGFWLFSVVGLLFVILPSASARNPVQLYAVQPTTALISSKVLLCTSVVLFLTGVFFGARKFRATYQLSKLKTTRDVGTQTCGEALVYDEALEDELLLMLNQELAYIGQLCGLGTHARMSKRSILAHLRQVHHRLPSAATFVTLRRMRGKGIIVPMSCYATASVADDFIVEKHCDCLRPGGPSSA